MFPNRMQMSDIVPGGFREKYFHFIRQCMVMAFTYNRMAPGVSSSVYFLNPHRLTGNLPIITALILNNIKF